MERWHGEHERSYEGSNFSNQEDLISQEHTYGWNLVSVDGNDFPGDMILFNRPTFHGQKHNSI